MEHTAPKRLLAALLAALAAAAPAAFPLAAGPQQAGGAAAPPPPGAVAPADAPYRNNLVQNPSFEKSLVSDPQKGWKDYTANGMDIDVDSPPRNKPEAAPDGKKALHFRVKKPVNYKSSELNGPWQKFMEGGIVSGNKSEGVPYGYVYQLVPVKQGAVYAFRFRWLGSGLYYSGAPGRDRGLVEGIVQCSWRDKRGEPVAADSDFPSPRYQSFRADAKEPGWTTVCDPDLTTEGIKKNPKQVLYTPPPGAEFLRIDIRFGCRREKVRPEFWIDQVEFAEQPEGTKVSPLVPIDAPKPAAAPAAPAAPAAQPAPAPAQPAAPNAK